MIALLVGTAIALVLGIPTLTFAVELALGLLPPRRSIAPIWQGRFAVIIPAHDEAAGIGPVLADLRQALPKEARLLVVADNCRDDTARIARAAGAEVIERTDPARPGKGHALAFARDHLAADPPKVVVVVDADCRVEGAGVERLAAIAYVRRRPVQATYLMAPRPDAGPMVQLSGFAMLVRNMLRQRGLRRLRAPVVLTGSGMAFPWRSFAAARLATGETVEDLVLGVEFTLMGVPPRYAPGIRVWSDPAGDSGTREQRRRWEQGSLAAAWRLAPRLLLSPRPGTTMLALDMLVPPLALLVLLDGAGIAIAFLLAPVAAMVLAALAGLAGLLILAAWALYGRAQMRGRTLFKIPFYILWKLPIYAGALIGRERRWTRTSRDA
ncbi:glycosyltransferase family 2 protein [Sphingomonas montanisoli]|uniref:Glycosyltransferase n=1 Tax=Sphingomonas montanisoli TaxID=2606412 RepID=A0A5D9CAD3_9SPHN|nr:glycosyltransferase family 2 protein [Sphingomonas montanisoli]TZG28020.1 glycosyltransferase [Sphingomonas montanisoli]